MSSVHAFAGFALLAIYTVGWVWGAGLLILDRRPNRWFWVWLSVAQVAAVVQALIGLILVLAGFRPTTWLHYVYGAGPLVIFAIGHLMARELKGDATQGRFLRPEAMFTAAAFISFGLSMRALMTGLGLG
jgi:hypothetical protein